MALPTKEKTWQYNRNQAVGSMSSLLLAAQDAMYKIKTSLVGFGSGAWTVPRSSDSASAGASDYWLASTNLVWASGTTAHSWIVLRNPVGAELLIDLNSATSNMISVFFSPQAHFTGGTINARPTATDEQTMQSAASWCYSAAWVGKLHVWNSTDGKEMRILIAYNGFPTWMLAVGESKDPPSAWTNPYWAAVLPFTQTDPGCAGSTFFLDGTRFRGYVNGVSVAFSIGGEAYKPTPGTFDLVSVNQTFADEDTGDWPVPGMSLWSVTAAHRGRRGEIKDWWWGSVTRITADGYPSDGTKQFVQVGDTILPWAGDSVAMQMT